MARGAQDPDGLANDVMVEVFGALPRFKGGESALRGFMFHVARKRLIDDYRKQSRRLDQSLGLDGHDLAVPANGIDEMLGLERAKALLSQLTDDQRDVLMLRVLCDLSIAEVSTALGKPVTAIKALQRRGIASLRKKISAATVS
jgi:RNA polymerase sigma factor (sigma-70 family)